jgi:hypothetical protein
MWGTFGMKITESLVKQKSKEFPSWYAGKTDHFNSMVDSDIWAFDCVGLIKGVLWGWTAEDELLGGAVYKTNTVPDVTANGLKERLIHFSTDFSTIVAGEAVWIKGHIGVYVGNGKVIEATNRWESKVLETVCLNVTDKGPDDYARKWYGHGKIPWVDYIERDDDVTIEQFKDLYNQMVSEKKGDNPSEWAKDATEKAKEKGVFNGDGQENYNWQDPITRESIAVVLENSGVLDSIPNKNDE